MNLNGSPHLNSLMLLTWYPISISHILPSLVLFHCPDHAVAFVPCLYILLMGIFPCLISLVYSVCLFLLTLSFHALFGVSSQNFQTSFHLILTFLTHTFNLQEIKLKNSIKKEKQNQYTNRRQITESPPPDFLRGHSGTPPLYLCSPPSCSLPLSPISTLSQPQFSPIGLCSSSGPLPSPRGTS